MLFKKIFSRGQVSGETLVVVCIILILSIIIFSYNGMLQSSTEITYSTFSDKANCLKLAFLMSETYLSGEGSKTIVSLKNPAQIFSANRTVKVGSEFCRFLANTSDYNLQSQTYSLSVLDQNLVFS